MVKSIKLFKEIALLSQSFEILSGMTAIPQKERARKVNHRVSRNTYVQSTMYCEMCFFSGRRTPKKKQIHTAFEREHGFTRTHNMHVRHIIQCVTCKMCVSLVIRFTYCSWVEKAQWKCSCNIVHYQLPFLIGFPSFSHRSRTSTWSFCCDWRFIFDRFKSRFP